MTEALGAAKGERTERRLGHWSGYNERDLITRLGKFELRFRRTRGGRFSTELFERYARAEKALLGARAEKALLGRGPRCRDQAIWTSATRASAILIRLCKSAAPIRWCL